MTVAKFNAKIFNAVMGYVGSIGEDGKQDIFRFWDIQCILRGVFFDCKIGECRVTERSTGKTLLATVHRLTNEMNQPVYNVRLNQTGIKLAEMILLSFSRPEDCSMVGYMYRKLLPEYTSSVEIRRLDGGTRKGNYHGAGSALCQVAAEVALSDQSGLYTDGVGDSWGFYRKMKMTSGSKERDAEIDEIVRHSSPGKDLGSQTFVLDKEGWEFWKARIAKAPIIKKIAQ